MFLKRESGLLGLIKANFLLIFIGFSAYAPGKLLLVGSHFDFQVADHSTITIILNSRIIILYDI